MSPHHLGVELCEAWGLEVSKVQNISIDVAPTHTTVLVQFRPEGGSFVPTLAKYRLVADEGAS